MYSMFADRWDIIECPNCQALFTENHIVLSLPIPVLKYLEKYVSSTRKAVLKPLHEVRHVFCSGFCAELRLHDQVFDLLVDALDGTSVGLPNPAAIIPYIGLFTMVTLNPTTTARSMMVTPYLPGLSIIHNNKFKEASANTSATAKNVARIFDLLDIEEDTPFNIGGVPLAPGVAAFEEKRYWRIPVFAGAIFAALMARLLYDSSKCEDIVLARRIVAHLTLKSSGGSGPSGGPSSGRGGGRGGGGGSREGGRRQSKRKNASGEGSPSTEKGKKKARRVAGGDSGECSDASGEALRPFPVHLGPYWNVGVPPGVHSQYGQSGHLEIGDDTPAIDTNKDNSDSETGLSEHS